MSQVRIGAAFTGAADISLDDLSDVVITSVVDGDALIYESASALWINKATIAVSHNALLGIQGGTTNQYYHITSAQATVVANTSNINTGDVTLATNHGLGLTGQVINMGTPSNITSSSTNSVTTTTHTHAIDSTIAASAAFLKLDQSSPQSIISGRPTFAQGFLFGTSPTIGTFVEGKMYYNATNKCINAEIDTDITLALGEQDVVYAYNPGAQITKGQLVYPISGFGAFPTIGLAKADAEATSLIIGVSAQTIASTGYGFVLVRGVLEGTASAPLATDGFSVGDTLYLSPGTAGEFTKTAPSVSQFLVRVGVCLVSHATLGAIYIRPILKNRITDLADVVLATPAVDEVLRYNGLNWVNGASVTSSASAGVEFYNDDASIIGTGTNNTHPVESLLKIPRTAAEQAEVVEAFPTGGSATVYGEAYLYNVALARTSMSAGTWAFQTYCSVNTSTSGNPQIIRNVYRVIQGVGTLSTAGPGIGTTATAASGTPFVSGDGTADITTCGYLQTPQGLYEITTGAFGGDAKVAKITTPAGYSDENNIADGLWKVWKFLFSTNTGNIPYVGTSYGLLTTLSTQGAFSLTANGSDNLGEVVFAKATASKTINFLHNGAVRASHIDTPLVTLHGNLAGLQGGTGSVPTEQYYHLTSAQLTVATQAATASLNGYATSTQITKLDGITAGATANAKITSATLDTGSDDTGFTTALAISGSHNVPHSVPGTAGKVLVSDGTDWITSTPTFPNASATTGKVIKSDGTNWVASTETYAAPGTSSNIMTSDGTNWTSAAPAAITQIASVVGTTNTPTTTSATYVDMPEMSITITTTGGKVLIWFTGDIYNTVAGADTNIILEIDGGDIAETQVISFHAAANYRSATAIVYCATGLSSASHTFKIQYNSGGGGTAAASGTRRSMVVMEVKS